MGPERIGRPGTSKGWVLSSVQTTQKPRLYNSKCTRACRPGNTSWDRQLTLLTAGFVSGPLMKTQAHGRREGPQPSKPCSMDILSAEPVQQGSAGPWNKLQEICSGSHFQTPVSAASSPKKHNTEKNLIPTVSFADTGLKWSQNSLSSRQDPEQGGKRRPRVPAKSAELSPQ